MTLPRNQSARNEAAAALWERAARARRMALKLIGDRAEKDLLALADELEAEALHAEAGTAQAEKSDRQAAD